MVNNSAIVMGMAMFSEDSVMVYHNIYKIPKIISFITKNNKMQGDYKIIDTDKNITYLQSKKDSAMTSDSQEYLFSSNRIVKVIIDKKQKKIIKGIKCYLVTYEFQEEESQDVNYLEFAGKMITKRTMWVTNKFNTLYHPIVKDKQILENYYPLEIIETQNDVQGYEKRYIVDKFILL